MHQHGLYHKRFLQYGLFLYAGKHRLYERAVLQYLYPCFFAKAYAYIVLMFSQKYTDAVSVTVIAATEPVITLGLSVFLPASYGGGQGISSSSVVGAIVIAVGLVTAGLICGPVGAAVCGIGTYRLWNLFSDEEPNLHSGRKVAKYCVISAICAMTVSWILAFGLYLLEGVWLEQIYIYVFFNNLGFSIGLGMPLFIILTSDSIRIECRRFTGKNYIL